MRLKHKALLLGLVLLAAALRLWRLPVLPPGLWYDEAVNGADVRMVLSGAGAPIYFTANNGREPLFIYFQALAVAFLGARPLALRLVSAFSGILTVPIVYWTAHVFLQGSSRERPVNDEAHIPSYWPSLIAAAGIAVSYWHLSLSRLALRAVLLVPLSALAVAFFYRAWMRGRARDYALAGLWFAAGIYTYTAGRVLLLVPVLFILVEVGAGFWTSRGRPRAQPARERAARRLRLRGLGILAAVVAALCLPLAAAAVQDPSILWSRMGQVSIIPTQAAAGAWPDGLLTNLVAVARDFYDAGDRNLRHNLPGRPANDPLLALLFTLGWLAAIRHARQARYRLLLIWPAVMLVPTLLSTEAPHSLRAAGALPPLALLYGLGARAALDMIRRPAWQKYARPLLVLALVLVSGSLTARDYFGRWAGASGLGDSFSLQDQLAAEVAAGLMKGSPDGPSGPSGPLLLSYRLFAQPQMVFALGPTSQAPVTSQVTAAGAADGHFLLEGSFDRRQPMFVVWREGEKTKSAPYGALPTAEAAGLAQALARRPDTQVVAWPVQKPGWPEVFLGPLPPAVRLAPRLCGVPLDVTFANGMHLAGYEVHPDWLNPASTGSSFRLTLFWRIGRDTPRSAAADDVFVHLADKDAVWLTQNGRLTEEYWLAWLPDERVLTESRSVPVPAGMPRGKAYFEVGLYRSARAGSPGSEGRVSIVDDEGRAVADQVNLGAVEMGGTPAQADLSGLRPFDATFEGGVALAGWQVVKGTSPGAQLTVDLGWRAAARSASDYTAFVHLIDANGRIIAQHDQPPGGPDNPTSRWVPGETVRSPFVLQPPAGTDLKGLRLRVGLYEPVSGRQLPLNTLSDAQYGAPGDSYLILPLEDR